MALDGIYNVPDFKYVPRVERSDGKKEERGQHSNSSKKKKKDENGSQSLFESLADSLGQYSDEPFQFNG